MANHRPRRKVERAGDRPDRDENEYGSQSIAGLDVRHIGILVQTFAIFVAVSTLLGRIHTLAYYEALGIPVSEIRLSVIDYSVVSPESTTFGVGFSIIIAVYFWYDWQQALKTISLLQRIPIGILFLIIGIIFGWFILVKPPDANLVYLIILLLMSMALGSFGTIMLVSGLAIAFLKNDEQSEPSKAMMPLIVILVMGCSVGLGAQFSSTIGRVEALNTLMTAPVASIEIAPSSVHDPLRYGSEECSSESLGNCYRVILVSDKFVYLRPLETETPGERLYALPVEHIAGINYVFEEARMCPNEGC